MDWNIIENTDNHFKHAREIIVKIDELKVKDYRKGVENYGR